MARRNRPPRPGGRPRGRKRRPPRARQTGPSVAEIPDTPAAELEDQARKDVAQLIAARRVDRGLSEAERLLARIIDQHPEYADVFETADKFVVTGDEDSPFVHVALHRVVEQRVVSREGGEMTRLARDKPWHEAVHEAAEQVAVELFGEEESAVEGA